MEDGSCSETEGNSPFIQIDDGAVAFVVAVPTLAIVGAIVGVAMCWWKKCACFSPRSADKGRTELMPTSLASAHAGSKEFVPHAKI